MIAQYRLLTRQCPLCPHTQLAQHIGYAVTAIEIIIHHQRPAVAKPRDLHLPFLLLVEPERKGNRKFRSHTLLALHLDGTVHHIHNILGNRHTKTRSRNPA